MVIGINSRRDRQVLLVLPFKHLLSLPFCVGICLSGPSTPYYCLLSIGEYSANKKDNIRVFPGKLVNLTV